MKHLIKSLFTMIVLTSGTFGTVACSPAGDSAPAGNQSAQGSLRLDQFQTLNFFTSSASAGVDAGSEPSTSTVEIDVATGSARLLVSGQEPKVCTIPDEARDLLSSAKQGVRLLKLATPQTITCTGSAADMSISFILPNGETIQYGCGTINYQFDSPDAAIMGLIQVYTQYMFACLF